MIFRLQKAAMTKKFTAQGSCAVNSNNEVSLISFVNNKFGIRCTDLSLWSIRIKFTAFFVRIDWSTVSLHIFVILEELRREVIRCQKVDSSANR
jgi:hypothetical protein